MTTQLNLDFEKAIRLLAVHLPVSEQTSRKPILFHSIRVGVYLYDHSYSPDIVIAGVLHDAIEWSTLDATKLRAEFDDTVTNLVLANTKNNAIADSEEKIAESIKRCVQAGQEALIIKAADTLDSFKWYASQNNLSELRYCLNNSKAIDTFKPEQFNDQIFSELKIWQEKFSQLG